MKLIVFLGNIGAKYEFTRHNAGFLFADELKNKWSFSEWRKEEKFFGEISEGEFHGEKILFLKPHTLMNRSGKAVHLVQNFYKIPLEEILICHDEKDLPFGEVRYREKGSSGGQNGVRNIHEILGTQEIKRLKIGIDTAEREKFASTSDFVLSRFSSEELEKLPEISERAEKIMKENFLKNI